MSNFFGPLALWQKMSLVLACAIVFTVTLGCCKLLYNRRKLRQYALDHVLTTPLNNPVECTSETLFKIDIEANRNSKIPFGVRALESGIEVDGVWISPNSSPRSSRESSPESWRRKSQFASGVSQSSLLRNELGDNTTIANSHRSIGSDSTAFERVTSAQRLPSASSLFSVQSTSYTDIKSARPERYLRGRSLPRDLSFLDIEPFPLVLQQDQPSLQSDPLTDKLMRHTKHHSRRASREVSSGAIGSPVKKKARDPSSSYILVPLESPYETEEDAPNGPGLDLADMPRLAQAASMGQLIPKIAARPAQNNMIPAIKVASPQFVETPKSILQLADAIKDEKPPSTASTGADRSLSPHAHMDASSDEDKTQRRSTRGSIERYQLDPKYSFNTIRSFKIHRDPGIEVLRQVNTGFAVIQPGTVRPVPQAAEEVSLQDLDSNAGPSRARKLRKKRPDSSLRKKFTLFRRLSHAGSAAGSADE